MGTDAWRNWRAFKAEAAEIENFDDDLQSDVQFFGMANCGPFELSSVIREPGSVGSAVILRGAIHTSTIPKIIIDDQLAPNDSTAYHGGTMGDEIAALVSLSLGVRLRLAGTIRVSGIHDPESPKVPIYFEVPRLTRPGPRNREMIPRVATRRADLDALSRLHSFPDIDETAQAELVRAARSYATGLWWANEDPNQAWLQMVTAAEIAAKCRQILTADPVDLLQELWVELWEVIQSADPQDIQRIASLLNQQIRATRTFKDFLVECAPSPPDVRPAFDQLDWRQMRRHANKIYSHRSDSLHSGVPFPLPMLEEPRSEAGGVLQEVPSGLNTGGLGGVWDKVEAPMLLSTFEYIVRGALLRWWDELISATEE